MDRQPHTKDVAFLNVLLRHGLVRVPVIIERLSQTVLPADRLATCQARLDRLVKAGGK